MLVGKKMFAFWPGFESVMLKCAEMVGKPATGWQERLAMRIAQTGHTHNV